VTSTNEAPIGCLRNLFQSTEMKTFEGDTATFAQKVILEAGVFKYISEVSVRALVRVIINVLMWILLYFVGFKV
jgi:hypothetical protein